MIVELMCVGYFLIQTQQLQVLIHLLHNLRNRVKMQLSCSVWSATLEEAQRLLKFEEEHHKDKQTSRGLKEGSW